MSLGPKVNDPTAGDCSPWISADGLELYFSSYRSGGYGRSDIYVTRRATPNNPWGDPVNLGPVVNSTTEDVVGSLSPDGLLLLFADNLNFGDPPRPGGNGGCDIWMTRRVSISGPWEPPVNLGSRVNTSAHEILPRISPDGSTLYFTTNSGDTWNNWQASIAPICDFNGDSRVDGKDLLYMAAQWSTDDLLCDIGPFAWGDGIVDAHDFMAFMKCDTVEVPCDVTLNWPAADSAQAYDVYLGPSFEDVNDADRDHPMDVLVSQDQSATSFDCEGLLEFGQTTYWRVDEVAGASGAPGTSVIKGEVLSFTVEPVALPIENVTASALGAQLNMGPEKTIDGSGLNERGQHSTDAMDMWLAAGADTWIQYDFDKILKLHELLVWNQNTTLEAVLSLGVKEVTIDYTVDGETWTALEGVATLNQGTGLPTYEANTAVALDGIVAKSVKLSVVSAHGPSDQSGLAEVRFLCKPTRARHPLPADGQTEVALDATLDWRPGRAAVSHRIYLSEDPQAVMQSDPAALVAATSSSKLDLAPLALGYGTIYYWKVNEINEGNEVWAPDLWEGDLWSFTTQDYLIVDDFESYGANGH